MNASEALGRLRGLRVPAATTADAPAILGLSIEAALRTRGNEAAAAGLRRPAQSTNGTIARRRCGYSGNVRRYQRRLARARGTRLAAVQKAKAAAAGDPVRTA